MKGVISQKCYKLKKSGALFKPVEYIKKLQGKPVEFLETYPKPVEFLETIG